MTAEEMKQEFDVLYNNIMSNAAPGLDDYEISLFLTKAQEELLKSYFNPKGNKYGEGFDFSPKRQVDFSNIIVSKNYTGNTCFTQTLIIGQDEYLKYDPRSYAGQVLQAQGDAPIFLRLNESARLAEYSGGNYHYGRVLQVIPLMYSEYSKYMTKPYKYPLKNFCWRLEFAGNAAGVSEFITAPTNISNGSNTYIPTMLEYRLRYLRKPCPIIVGDLSGYDITIDDVDEVTSCELDPIIHREIVQRAVEIAKSTYMGDLKSAVTLGQRSE